MSQSAFDVGKRRIDLREQHASFTAEADEADAHGPAGAPGPRVAAATPRPASAGTPATALRKLRRPTVCCSGVRFTYTSTVAPEARPMIRGRGEPSSAKTTRTSSRSVR